MLVLDDVFKYPGLSILPFAVIRVRPTVIGIDRYHAIFHKCSLLEIRSITYLSTI